MSTRRRRGKRPAAKRSTSNINAAQQEAREKRLDAKKTAEKTPPKKSIQTGPPATKLEARTDTPMSNSGRGVDQDAVAKRDSTLSKGINEATQTIAGLTMPMVKRAQAEAAASSKRPLADPRIYGQVSDKGIKDRLTALQNEQIALKNRKLKEAGGAVYLGTKKQQIRREQRGGEFEGGTNRTPQSVDVDDVRSKDELMSWLADEKTFNEIKKKMNASGISVQSYDDVAKLWSSVIDQAAATYSSTGKKVTPWALLSLRGKNMVNGKPASKTTTSTSIEELDPAQAKVMVKNTLSQMLGRDPKKEEIEDFIAKAQTIARQNPQITKTTTQYDFAGDPTSQSSVSSGGQDVVTAKAQLAAEEQAKQSEDYAAYQGAGVYMPWLMDALSSPV